MTNISTGVPALDRALKGGYRANTLNAVIGDHGMGKTAVLLASAVSVVNDNSQVLYLDMSGLEAKRFDTTNLFENDLFSSRTVPETMKQGFIESMALKAIKEGIRLVIVDGPLTYKQLNVNHLLKELPGSNTTFLFGTHSLQPGHPWMQLLLDTQLSIRYVYDRAGRTDDIALAIQKSRTQGAKTDAGVVIKFRDGCLLQGSSGEFDTARKKTAQPPTRFERDFFLPLLCQRNYEERDTRPYKALPGR